VTKTAWIKEMWHCDVEQILCDVLKDCSALKAKAWRFLETLQNTGILTQCYMSEGSGALRRDSVMLSECLMMFWRIVVLWGWRHYNTLQSFTVSGTSQPMTQRHIPENLCLQ
jgi:hypothetical protein